MSQFRFILNDVSAQIESAFSAQKSNSMYDEIAIAATGAIRQAGDMLKERGRANIGAAGFSKKWQNAWRIKIFPSKGQSINAAVWAWHKIPYAVVFEEGARIVGKSGLLWLPLPNVPKLGRRKATPRNLINSGVKLFSMRSSRGTPLLATDVRVPTAQAGRRQEKLSLGKLRKGAAGKRGRVQAVPLFHGVESVTIGKRFDLAGVARTVQQSLGELYFANLNKAGD